MKKENKKPAEEAQHSLDSQTPAASVATSSLCFFLASQVVIVSY